MEEEDGKYLVVAVPRSVSEFHTLRLCHPQLQCLRLGEGRDGAGPGRLEQRSDLAVGHVALLEHMALITGKEQV